MINTKEIIKTINAIIKQASTSYYNGVVSHGHIKPDYNIGGKKLLVCLFGLDVCNSFYKSINNEKICKKECPFGLIVAKKSFDTSSNYQTISIFSIVGFNKKDISGLLNNLPRKLKKKKNAALVELENIEINSELHLKHKNYLEGLLETLLIGRIGLSIQAISHQFFTPLQGAMSDVKNIEMNNDKENSTERLIKNFNLLNKLATEIQLILSTSDEFNYNMLRRVTVHQMVDEIFNSLKSYATEKNIELKQGYNNISKTVDAIPSQINIVLNNIIHNAVKYSYKGFPESPLEVKVNYKSENDFLIIQVTNEGCKITDEEINERLIFNLSYRGEHSNDGTRTGSGSGLFIADKIVNAHGGQIKVSSSYCGGDVKIGTDRYFSTFNIYWPIIIDED